MYMIVETTIVQGFPTFLMLHPLETVPRGVATPGYKITSLLLHNCHFASAMNDNVNIRYATSPKGHGPQLGNHCHVTFLVTFVHGIQLS